MEATQFFKCLSDETRLRTVLLIFHETELCVCELTQALQVTQPKISRHLALLKQSGVLSDRRQSQWIFYHINENLPSWAVKVISTIANDHKTLLQPIFDNLNQMGDRPERVKNHC